MNSGFLKIAAAALACVALFTGGCGPRGGAAKDPAGADSTQTVLVRADEVKLADERRLESGISFTGELSPQYVTDITARFAGDISRVLVREGQPVRRGQPLAVFKPRDVRDQVLSAEAEYLSAQSAVAAARNVERRARRLLDAGAAAPSDLEAAEAGLKAAEARLSMAEAIRNRAREDSEKLDVPSPIDGWVSRIVVHEGNRPAVGDPLLTIVNTDTMELAATIPSEALGRVTIGTPIRFRTDAFPGEQFEGHVDRLGPTTEPGTRQVRIYTRIPNPGHRLIGGLFARGRVIDRVNERALAAPASALRQEGPEQVVYRVANGRAERVVVRTGMVDEENGYVELIGSVAPRDSLLTGVLPGIRNGILVRVVGRPDSAARR